MVDKKKWIWKGAVNKTNKYFEGGMKHDGEGYKGYWANKQERQAGEYLP